jgi:hypothetical protein
MRQNFAVHWKKLKPFVIDVYKTKNRADGFMYEVRQPEYCEPLVRPRLLQVTLVTCVQFRSTVNYYFIIGGN